MNSSMWNLMTNVMLHVTVQKILYKIPQKVEKTWMFMNVLYHIDKSEKLPVYLNKEKK